MADTGHDIIARKKGLAEEYGRKVQAQETKQLAALTDKQRCFFKPLGYGSDTQIGAAMQSALRASPTLTPSAYIRAHFGWMFGTVIEEKYKEQICCFADGIREYPYSVSFYRRPFRAIAYVSYTTRILEMIRQYRSSTLADAPLDRILNHELPEEMQAYWDLYSWHGGGYNPWQIAYALDHHEEKVEEAVRRILTEENGTGMLTRPLIEGIFYSHRQDFYDLLGQLLLAARLQEGLRQAICESADCGTKEGFLTILKVIDENDLIRFSSVKRAVGTWLGIVGDEARDLERVGAKSVALMISCLQSKEERIACGTSEDSMKIHIALWSLGYSGVEFAFAQIAEMVQSGTPHQLLTAGYFVANLDEPRAAHKLAKLVLSAHADKADMVAVWLPNFMPGAIYAWNQHKRSGQPADVRMWFDDRAELDRFYALLVKMYTETKEKERVFSPCIFPWYEARYTKAKLAELVCIIAYMSGDASKFDDACPMIRECDADGRYRCFMYLLTHPKTEIQRRIVLEGMGDKSTYVRAQAAKIAETMLLRKEEYRLIEEHLRFKSADICQAVMKLLLRQQELDLKTCLARLLDSGKEDVRCAALDMLTQLQKDSKRIAIVAEFAPQIAQLAEKSDVSAKEKILLDALKPRERTAVRESAPLFTPEDRYLPTVFDEDYLRICVETYTRYFPDAKLSDMLGGGRGKTSVFQKIARAVTGKESASCAEARADLESLSRLVDEHKHETILDWSGEEVLLGNESAVRHLHKRHDGPFPLAALWDSWREQNGIGAERLLRAEILSHAYREQSPFSSRCADTVCEIYGNGFDRSTALAYGNHVQNILAYLHEQIPTEDLERLAFALTVWFVRCVPDDLVMVHAPMPMHRLPRKLEMAHLLTHRQIYLIYGGLQCHNDAKLPAVFPAAIAAAEKCVRAYQALPDANDQQGQNGGYVIGAASTSVSRTLRDPNGMLYGIPKPLPGVAAYLRAAYRGIITEAQLYQFLMQKECLREALNILSDVTSLSRERDRSVSGRGGNARWNALRRSRTVKDFLEGSDGEGEEDIALLAYVEKVYDTILPVVLSAELTRGESPTAYSHGIRGISRIYGTVAFAELLHAMGKDALDRSCYYGWGSSVDRRGTLSHLISVCIPYGTDTVDSLRAALEGKKVSRKRLIEAALYSPEWIPLIGEYLQIPSFESACCYFMAHMNEQFDDKKQAMITRYTPLSADELNLGAFDINWFRSAYEALEEKEFDLIYDAAKYISDGAKHSRARKYADAVLGRFEVSETEKAVSDKRNKDLLMAYALIPLAGEDDICRRYLFIQNFRKESKQFGSQRATNEGKACDMALANLAMNAGYTDTMRLTLRMETKMIEDRREMMREYVVDGVSLRLEVDSDGKAGLIVAKDGKTLKSVPAKLKKHETVLALNDLKKKLTEQYRRTRVMLEQAMEDGIEFTVGELCALTAHPVVFSMLSKLVFVSGAISGFPNGVGLTDFTGVSHTLPSEARAVIAHPYHLYRGGIWQGYQTYLFEQKLVQPFRQVFRELYIKTEEELLRENSLRYAGNQIQPAKTAATLKSRRWVADMEVGLQKVYYKDNIVARIWALADWFSPADIEAPTLEWVEFADRKTGAPVRIADVPDIIFSEVMRDVDLAVSVAHAGGVDPETSHSTIEMRAALLAFLLPMFRVNNVRVEGKHVLIDGKLADYSIHLGSGVIHQVGAAMIPVLPVHSQQRGKIFLPFADEDPKTAEIVSKILLFAEDDKIKDPSILACISRFA